MLKRSLLAAGMLSVLLATSACGALTGATNSPAKSPGQASARPEVNYHAGFDMSSDEIGATQRAAAAAAAKKAEAAGATTAALAQGAAAEAQAAGLLPGPPAAAAARALARAAVPKSAPKPGLAPLLPTSPTKNIDNTADSTAPTWHDNTPVGPAANGHAEQSKGAGRTDTDEDPISGQSDPTGEDVDSQTGKRNYFPNVRRNAQTDEACGGCNDPKVGPCHDGDDANGTNLSD